jgi:hypothetical protein
MTRVFAQQIHYARVTEGWAGVLRVWIRSLADLLATAPAEHMQDEELVSSPAGFRQKPTVVQPKRLPGLWILLGVLPAWVALFLLVAAPNYSSAIFLTPPAILGLPAGLVVATFAILWAVIGFVVIVNASSMTVRIVAFMLFTVPTSLVLLLVPGMILVLINLTT